MIRISCGGYAATAALLLGCTGIAAATALLPGCAGIASTAALLPGCAGGATVAVLLMLRCRLGVRSASVPCRQVTRGAWHGCCLTMYTSHMMQDTAAVAGVCKGAGIRTLLAANAASDMTITH
jgi:hypothetical protein